jgi:hypothetical protein
MEKSPSSVRSFWQHLDSQSRKPTPPVAQFNRRLSNADYGVPPFTGADAVAPATAKHPAVEVSANEDRENAVDHSAFLMFDRTVVPRIIC